MARPLRLEYPGAVYHVTSRGNHRQITFPDDEHRTAFLGIMTTALRRFNMICHAYCLMDNHYHLLIETPEGNLSQGMRQVNGVYTQYFNRKGNKSGHLFHGRYKAILIEKDAHLLEVVRYVLLNPVRAGMVSEVGDYAWSSYRGMCGLEQPHPCLSTAWVNDMFGTGRRGTAGLQQFVADGLGEESPWTKVTAQVILGSASFCSSLEPVLKGQGDLHEVPAVQRLLGRPSLDMHFKEMTRRDRNRLIRSAVEEWGYAQNQVSEFLGLHYSSVSRILKAELTPPAKQVRTRTTKAPANSAGRTQPPKQPSKGKAPKKVEDIPQLSLF